MDPFLKKLPEEHVINFFLKITEKSLLTICYENLNLVFLSVVKI